MTTGHKLLIEKDLATVAEGRQGKGTLSRQNEKTAHLTGFACRTFETLHPPLVLSYNFESGL